MALKKFIGARYAPEFAGAWSNSKQYAALSVVYADNRSYVSRKTVPAGTPITNTDFWIQSSDWNAQVAEYNLKVEGYNANVEKYNKNVQDYSAEVRGFYADTLHSFDTKADMQADRTLALGETLLTCGDKRIGDGGGSFYQVVSETSVTAVALDNGLFAEPFEFQPYDYSQFQQEVEGYKDNTTRVYNTQQDMVADVGISAGNILMTTGALEQGDGQGSFWNVSDANSEGAIALNNGKYAKKFNLTSVETTGNLLFNNKGNQVAIWGIYAGNVSVNIPISYNLNETRTVFVAVEFDYDHMFAEVTLIANGPKNFTKLFPFTETNVASGQIKTVIYAITLSSKGNNVYTGRQEVTSYLTTLDRLITAGAINVPNQSQALTEWNGPSTDSFTANFNVNTDLVIKDVETFVSSGTSSSSDSYDVIGTIPTTNGEVGSLKTFTSNTTSGIKTFDFYKYIKAGSSSISFSTRDSGAFIHKASLATGNYDSFNFTSGNFQGKINYFAVNTGNRRSYSTSNPNATWTGEKTESVRVDFTVSSECILHSFTVNTVANALIILEGLVNSSFSAINNTTGIVTLYPDIYLVPNYVYTLSFYSNGEKISKPSVVTGNLGPITFSGENNFYQGTMTIIEVNT